MEILTERSATFSTSFVPARTALSLATVASEVLNLLLAAVSSVSVTVADDERAATVVEKADTPEELLEYARTAAMVGRPVT